MELELLVVVNSGTSTEPDVRWWYFCSAGEEEQLESIAVMYMKTYMLECTQPVLVSEFSLTVLTQIKCMIQSSTRNSILGIYGWILGIYGWIQLSTSCH